MKDSLNYQVATLLEEQLPKYLTGIENMLPISLSPKTRRDLEKYLFSVRLDNEYNLKKTRRVRVPEQICEEIQQDGSRFVIVFVSDGFSRTMNNYSSLASLERVTKTALSASAMVLSPYRTGMTSRRSIQPHSSSLELFVLDVLKQEILKYQRDRLDLPPTNPFTIRQHLTALFLE
ncbi:MULTISPECIES: hypothetical protein [unclassified Spirosoma]|uniref:hypothetical protein n=1 Tax=unclassified Spirosoma TaxID=2621999 RepID=UPI001AC1D7BC|nr:MULTISPECIES: hypothetical protein [unclassified Spirosoma]MBN8821665.1 hypothetical protein [Spirosoma sp.]